MTDLRPEAVSRLASHLERLPGVGTRTARALVEHLLVVDEGEVDGLAQALAQLRGAVRHCSQCFLLTENDPCLICSDESRDHGVILVVEAPTTAWAVEATHQFNGVFHALLGHLSPLHGVGPDDLTIDALIDRVRSDEVHEVILATDPTVEGETTALYIARRLKDLPVQISRPASGIPVGGELAAVDRLTLAMALESRREV
ncbi:MAG: recombination protein RecR [Acidobacteria bacterium]|nr:MAG: recombination protein RecR [Acidobacteriota bacterium]